LRVSPNSIEHQDRSNLNQIRNIQKVLKRGEKVIAVVLQPRMLPGGSYLIPNIIYATNARIIVVDPHISDFGWTKVSIPYDIVTSIKLEEGPYSTLSIKFELAALINAVGLGMIHGIVGGKNRYERIIDAIPREKAEELMDAILSAMRNNSIKFRPRNLSDIKVRRVKQNASDSRLRILNI
jgi:hypothetical protein